jgi:hypothetical protein
VAGKTRDADKRTAGPTSAAPEQAGRKAGEGGAADAAEEVRPERPAEGRFEGRRSATVNLPFVTAQFRMPDMRAPSREELEAAAQGVRSLLPSRKSMLFYGGLAVTAAAGVIQWPVATAIGIGTALASRGAADPRPQAEAPSPPSSQDAPGT